ncbi:hypothetical protein BREVUG8_20053 [Brevundimonas sp. G8]|nr:hypothetical protein BREVUG8_20053 [Brevundimonas sp. G8]
MLPGHASRDASLPNGLWRLAADDSVAVNGGARPEGGTSQIGPRRRLNGSDSGGVKRPAIWRVVYFGRPGLRGSGARLERRPLYDGSHPAHPHQGRSPVSRDLS